MPAANARDPPNKCVSHVSHDEGRLVAPPGLVEAWFMGSKIVFVQKYMLYSDDHVAVAVQSTSL